MLIRIGLAESKCVTRILFRVQFNLSTISYFRIRCVDKGGPFLYAHAYMHIKTHVLNANAFPRDRIRKHTCIYYYSYHFYLSHTLTSSSCAFYTYIYIYINIGTAFIQTVHLRTRSIRRWVCVKKKKVKVNLRFRKSITLIICILIKCMEKNKSDIKTRSK